LTWVCSPKVTHPLVADIVDVDVVTDDRMTIWPDLARANLFGKALLDVLSYSSAPRRALHASGVDDVREAPHAFGVDDTFLVLVLVTTCSWYGSL